MILYQYCIHDNISNVSNMYPICIQYVLDTYWIHIGYILIYALIYLIYYLYIWYIYWYIWYNYWYIYLLPYFWVEHIGWTYFTQHTLNKKKKCLLVGKTFPHPMGICCTHLEAPHIGQKAICLNYFVHYMFALFIPLRGSLYVYIYIYIYTGLCVQMSECLNWYQVPGTRYLVTGSRCQVPGTRYQFQVPGTRVLILLKLDFPGRGNYGASQQSVEYRCWGGVGGGGASLLAQAWGLPIGPSSWAPLLWVVLRLALSPEVLYDLACRAVDGPAAQRAEGSPDCNEWDEEPEP